MSKSRTPSPVLSPNCSTPLVEPPELIRTQPDMPRGSDESFILSPMNMNESVLSDNISIETLSDESWWRSLEHDAKQMMKELQNREGMSDSIEDVLPNNVVSSLENSSDTENVDVDRVLVPRRRGFRQKTPDHTPDITPPMPDSVGPERTGCYWSSNMHTPENAINSASPTKAPVKPKRSRVFSNNPSEKQNTFGGISDSDDESPTVQYLKSKEKNEEWKTQRESMPTVNIVDWKYLTFSTIMDDQLLEHNNMALEDPYAKELNIINIEDYVIEDILLNGDITNMFLDTSAEFSDISDITNESFESFNNSSELSGITDIHDEPTGSINRISGAVKQDGVDKF